MSNIVSDFDAIVTDRKRKCVMIDDIQSHEIVTRIDTVHSLCLSFRDLESQETLSCRVNKLFFPLCTCEEGMNWKTSSFTEKCPINLVTQSVPGLSLLNLQHQPSVQLVKVTYGRSLGWQTIMEMSRLVLNPLIGTRRRNAKGCFFEELGYCYIAVQRRQCSLKYFAIKKNAPIIDLYNKICCSESFGVRDISKWRATMFKDICKVNCRSKLQRTSPDAHHIFIKQPTRQDFKCFKETKISGDCDTTVLDLICLDAVTPATIESLTRNLLGWHQDGTMKSVVASRYSFRVTTKRLYAQEQRRTVRLLRPRDGNCSRREVAYQWILAGFKDFICPSPSSISWEVWKRTYQVR